jgi:glycosyltransferase involved in cell wall biosynthesis
MASQSWSVIIFCYNEEITVKTVYHAVLDVLKKNVQANFEIVIVDDGSSDQSVNEIHKLQEQYPSYTKVVLHPKNLGIGKALRSGYTNSKYENVCAVPADGQFDVTELIPYLSFDERTIISFYRRENLLYTSFRNILSYINKRINSFFMGIRLRDVNWVKAYKNKEIKSFEWKLNSSLIESELCAKLLAKGNKVIEVVSVYHPRQAGVSKGASIKIVLQALKETLKLIFIMFAFKRKIR